MYQRTEATTTLDGGTVRTVEIAGDLPPASLGVAMMPGLEMSGRGMAFLDVLGSTVPHGPERTRRTRAPGRGPSVPVTAKER